VNDHRKIEFLGKIQLANEQLDLGIPVTELVIVVQTYLTDRHYPVPFAAVGDTGFPVIPGPGHLGGRNADAMVDVNFGFQIVVDLIEIPEVVADAHDARYFFLLCLLNDHQLFDGIFSNETNMCM
jgi:hypothetical protein